MKKTIGISALLLVIVLVTAFLNPSFLEPYNLKNNAKWTSMFAIVSIGEAFVIITGGIDLSVGSVIGLVGTLLPRLTSHYGVSPWLAVPLVMALAIAIGLFHGLLITKLKIQPFIVTLCGLMMYRSLARFMTGDQTQGFGKGFESLKSVATGVLCEAWVPWIGWVQVPMPFVHMILIAAVAAVFLHLSIYGRYMFALGRNEQAARFSGIDTDRMILAAYVASAALAGIAGIILALDVNSVQPADHGNVYELYAIAAAVLGGCSLRGGEGNVLGVVIGAAVIQVLRNAINMLEIASQLEYVIIGAVILVGVVADEFVKRFAARQTTLHDTS